MKDRPTEIPYIPKDRRGSRFAPRQGGKILRSSKGVEALRQTGAEDWGKREKKTSGMGCLVLMFVAWALFSGQFADTLQNLLRSLMSEQAMVSAPPSSTTDPIPDDEASPEVPVVTNVVPLPPPPRSARGPLGDLRGLFTSDDYPADALADEIEGTVRARLTIAPDGRVTSCEAANDDAPAVLAVRTCQVLTQRARFEPALDAEGRATVGTYTTPPIRWEIPRR